MKQKMDLEREEKMKQKMNETGEGINNEQEQQKISSVLSDPLSSPTQSISNEQHPIQHTRRSSPQIQNINSPQKYQVSHLSPPSSYSKTYQSKQQSTPQQKKTISSSKPKSVQQKHSKILLDTQQQQINQGGNEALNIDMNQKANEILSPSFSLEKEIALPKSMNNLKKNLILPHSVYWDGFEQPPDDIHQDNIEQDVEQSKMKKIQKNLFSFFSSFASTAQKAVTAMNNINTNNNPNVKLDDSQSLKDIAVEKQSEKDGEQVKENQIRENDLNKTPNCINTKFKAK
ncbi:MAG: hypothetical protein EZS28_043887 [Streblomastix strix]|uniref:Uncharacterized protein n=1 Tax=Streblomastix strix TaxID=222440 RepID=A0A5J4TQ48_9EUKA|nr:MAG: hypothetical protein EZS28_043887 [Streblomastix strix]